MKEIRLEITADACVRMLHDDAIDLSQFGKVKVKRASHVEFSNRTGKWYVQSAKTKRMLRADFATREAALAWEKMYYSPKGKGWKELTGGY